MKTHNELWTLIKERGYNPLRVAKKLGYSNSVVYAWTSGTREPCARDMIKLAEILRVPIEQIVRIFGEM